MTTADTAKLLADQDVQEAVIEVASRAACQADGLDPDVMTRDVDTPESDTGTALVPAWKNYRRLVARTLAIVGAASHAMNNLQGMVAAGNAEAKG